MTINIVSDMDLEEAFETAVFDFSSNNLAASS